MGQDRGRTAVEGVERVEGVEGVEGVQRVERVPVTRRREWIRGFRGRSAVDNLEDKR